MKRWSFFTTKEIKPCGWLKRQLEIQAEGLSGNLDKIWRDVRDSAWIGGDAEGWERVPYWLDGFIPLAYLLENEDMIARAKKYIDAMLLRQDNDGWICPCSEEEIEKYDTWAVQLVSKVLAVYYNCSGDERIPDALYRVMKNYYELMKSGRVKLFDWGRARWFEAFIAIRFLKERYDEPWLTELAKMLKEQGTYYLNLVDLWRRPLNKWTFETHIVNLAMMLKSEAVSADILGEEYTDLAEELSEILREYNGTPTGLFTGDECLSGLSPIQGTELCAVVEQMYSYEHLYAYTGQDKWAERLELLAFNALPATISDDMWAHQYVQMSNQIACQTFPGKSLFRTNSSDAHIFGLEPSYGCCTANFNQGWPKLCISTFMYNGSEIVSVLPIPAKLECHTASITQTTEYPFKNNISYNVKAKSDFTFKIRIPSFAKSLKINGEPRVTVDGYYSIDIPGGATEEITVTFETVPTLESQPYGLKYAKMGSLVFSVPIAYEKRMLEYERDGVERKFPYCDYEYIPLSEWSFAYSSDQLRAEKRDISSIPFSSENPPIVLCAKVRKINWGYADGYDSACARLPESIEPVSEEQEVALYPYGCAKLRMTEIPLI